MRRLGALAPFLVTVSSIPRMLKSLEIAVILYDVIFISSIIDNRTPVHEPYTAVRQTVMDGHPRSVHLIRSYHRHIASGTVTGAVLRVPYVRLIRMTVASPN